MLNLLASKDTKSDYLCFQVGLTDPCSSGVSCFTVDVVLLLRGHDREEMSATHATVLLSRLPALPLAKVTIAKPLELLPAGLTGVQVCTGHNETGGKKTIAIYIFVTLCFIKQLTLDLSGRSLLHNRVSKCTSLVPRRYKCLHSNKGSPDRSLQRCEDGGVN